RSTVGTMTELNDHLKLLFARTAELYCRGCGRHVDKDDPDAIVARLGEGRRAMVTFDVPVPKSMSKEEIQAELEKQGYTRIHAASKPRVEVIQDRLRLTADNRARLIEALEHALRFGRGRVTVYPLDDERRPGAPWKFSAALHCADCDIAYAEPNQS